MCNGDEGKRREMRGLCARQPKAMGGVASEPGDSLAGAAEMGRPPDWRERLGYVVAARKAL